MFLPPLALYEAIRNPRTTQLQLGVALASNVLLVLPLAFEMRAVANVESSSIMNAIPSRMVRVIPAEFVDGSRLAAPTAHEAWVTAAEDLAGVNTSQALARRLTLVDATGALIPGPRAVIEFDAVTGGLASPVFRDAPGFVGRGMTAGGAREFVIPNLHFDQLGNINVRILP